MTMNAAMNRLAREYQRLYATATPATPADGAHEARALVLEVARPAQWQPLAAVWQGVQADLGLPAPAIAANGRDGLQLWFSLAEPVARDMALAWLDGLRQRYMAGVPPHRVALMPAPAQAPTAAAGGPWPAFVAADLAPVFEDSPWLDLPPSDDGQADLLSRLASISPAAWAAAQPLAQAPRGQLSSQAAPPAAAPHAQAAQFLLQVMHDSGAPLALRVDAAKALLPYGLGSGPGSGPGLAQS